MAACTFPPTIQCCRKRPFAAFAGMSYGSVAKTVLMPYVGDDLDAATLEDMIAAAYRRLPP